jgi:toxin ParE1/3/4
MAFEVEIDPIALQDIQGAIDYYDEQQIGLGEKFEKSVTQHLHTLKDNPFFGVRYDQVRCYPMKKFPFMIHFTINEDRNLISIRAIFHTSRSPQIWKKRNSDD